MGDIFKGTFIHTPQLGQLEIFSAQIKVINGVITEIIDKIPCTDHKGGFYIPGFVDAHIHAPQTRNLSLGLDKPLLQWLDSTTFPTESKFTGDDYLFYKQVVKQLVKNGTTTACYFGTIQNEANLALVQAIKDLGQRAFVGKVCMDSNSPQYYIESTDNSVASTLDFITNDIFKSTNLVKPIITPRFAISCTKELLKGLGKIAYKHDLPIQTHISENPDEVSFVKKLFPDSKDYLDVYDQASLINQRTLLAHAIYLSEDELQRIKASGCTLVHCPNSNFSLNSGIARTRDWLECGIKVALGTDVSGGSSLSMLNAIQTAILASKSINLLKDQNYKPLTPIEAFSLATLGGGTAIGNRNVGKFEVGMAFDALFVEYENPFQSFTQVEDSFYGFLYNGDDRHIKNVIINGRNIHFD
jgi:guanine deaminase